MDIVHQLENNQSSKTIDLINVVPINNNSVPVFMEGVPNVRPVLDQVKSQRIQKRVANMLDWTRSGFPACVSVPMDRDNLNFLAQEEYLVAVKADGTRYLMFIDGHNEIYFVNRNNQIFQVDNLLPFPDPQFNLDGPSLEHFRHLKGTLIDGELLKLEDNQLDVKYIFLIFDGIAVNGECVMEKNLKQRMKIVREKVLEPRKKYLDTTNMKRTLEIEPFQFEEQQHWGIDQVKFVYRKHSKSLPYENDGLIFTCVNDPYNFYPAKEAPGRCDKKLKWKPSEFNTVDFFLNLGNLYVSDMELPFGQIDMTAELQKLNNSIIECNYKDGEWFFYRSRWDKFMPNNFHTASTTLKSIQEPVSEESLYEFIKHRGFKVN